MFEIDEDSVIASRLGERDDLGLSDDFDSNALDLLVREYCSAVGFLPRYRDGFVTRSE